MKQLDEKTAEQLGIQYLEDMKDRINAFQKASISHGEPFGLDELQEDYQLADQELQGLQGALSRNDLRPAYADSKTALEQGQVRYNEDSPEFRYLCSLVLKTKILEAQTSIAAHEGDHLKQQDLLKRTLSLNSHSGVGPAISSVWENYFKEKTEALPKPDWKETVRKGHQATFQEFMDILGDKPIGRFDRDLIFEWREKVSRLPKNRNKRFPGISIETLLEDDFTENERPSVRTIREKLTMLRTFFTWAVEIKDYLIKNPFDGIKIKSESLSYAPYTNDDIAALFRSKEYKEGLHDKTWRFWVPLIALYTGCRVNEIGQLAPADIIEEDGIWVFNISDGDDQTIKTAAGRRKVPISKHLISLGLIEYSQALLELEEARLFPDLKKGRTWGTKISKWFRESYKPSCGIENDPSGAKKVFHSFRHTAITKATSEGIVFQHCQQVFGHEKSLLGESATYIHGFPIETLVPVIESLNYDLDHSSYKLPGCVKQYMDKG